MRELLHLFPRPSHYAGIEDGACHKKAEAMSLRIALAFPDAYEVGMSYLGQKILYSIVNSRPGWWAERVMAPEREVADILRRHKVPLATLESDTPLLQLDAVCFSVTHELCYTDVLHMLDLGGIPLRAVERSEALSECPLVMAGGGAMLGAEPLVPFIDLVCLGDGEEFLPEALELLEKAKKAGWTRSEFLAQARHIAGAYVPTLFQMKNGGGIEPIYPEYRPARRIVSDINMAPYPTRQTLPVGAVHNRLSLEIARGCTRGCRFCHAGMVYRPARERAPAAIDGLLNDCLDETGFEEVSFLALSAGDYSALKTVWRQTFSRCAREQVGISLPSLRVGSVDDEIMAKMSSLRRAGVTLAPEAGSQRLRDVINKGISEDELILHLQKLLEYGWRQVKLYFMIGLPTETDEDLRAIVDLCRKARDAGGKGAPRLQITVGISPFVPKPFTPFQWEAQIGLEEMHRRIHLLLELFKKEKGISMRWHEPAVSHLEGILSRADRRMADVVEKAYRKGAIFCGWTEFFRLEPWLEALEECGMDADAYTGAIATDAPLPWDHIEAGISRRFLLTERRRALAGKTTPDCRYSICRHCGACETKTIPSLLARPAAREEPPRQRLVFTARDQQANKPKFDPEGRLVVADSKKSLPRINPALTVKTCQYRIWHAKTGGHAFLSQLELQAVITRAMRRARLPVSFSSGFHPMPLLSFGRALPVGVESRMEWFSVSLHDYVAPNTLRQKLGSVLAKGLEPVLVEPVTTKNRSIQSVAETFSLHFCGEEQLISAMDRFCRFAALDEFIYDHETKKGVRQINLRPMLAKHGLRANPDGMDALTFTADWSEYYISPLTLARAILSFDDNAGGMGPDWRLVKTGQIFQDGKEY